MKIIQETDVLAMENLGSVYEDLKHTVLRGVRDNQPLHDNGDMGETVALPAGPCCQRLEKEHARRYVSIFGEFVLSRVVYGSREGQQIDREVERLYPHRVLVEQNFPMAA